MKKLFTMLSFLTLSLGVSAQTISVAGDVEALANETVNITLHVAGVDAMTSNHFLITLPDGISLSSVDGTEKWAGLFSVNKETGEFSSIVSSDKSLTGEADIAVITLSVAAETAKGEYPVKISDVRINGVNLATEANFNVIVTDRITLDENSLTAPAARSGVNVKVKRTIKAGEWSTLCVPFTMTKAQATAAFGADVELKAYTSYTAEIDEVTLIPSAIVLNFTSYVLSTIRKIQAGTPYLIKTSQDIESFDVDGVTVSATTSDVSGPETEYGLAGKFSGVLAKTKVPDNGLFISGNKFYYSKGNTDIKAFRGWFNLEAIYNVALSVEAPVYLSFDDGTTRISLTENNNQKVDGAYYNLSGQRIANPQKGIFIQNGKKFVIK